ncbi:hypothetical protein C8J57DRAFT_1277811 [Mycena rebaudengoi]|nr:hypothetical protein C8J57DRAFT_1372395 [Mycena rebaudengoi]KAJ7289479.1 hypothetical protein C8J57DRAFT_1277811 [Mycena rebaudengoi]
MCRGVPLRRRRYVNCFFFLIPRSLLILPFGSCPACISLYSTTTKSSLAHCTLSSPCLQCLPWRRCAPIHGFDATRRRSFLRRPAACEGHNIYSSLMHYPIIHEYIHKIAVLGANSRVALAALLLVLDTS